MSESIADAECIIDENHHRSVQFFKDDETVTLKVKSGPTKYFEITIDFSKVKTLKKSSTGSTYEWKFEDGEGETRILKTWAPKLEPGNQEAQEVMENWQAFMAMVESGLEGVYHLKVGEGTIEDQNPETLRSRPTSPPVALADIRQSFMRDSITRGAPTSGPNSPVYIKSERPASIDIKPNTNAPVHQLRTLPSSMKPVVPGSSSISQRHLASGNSRPVGGATIPTVKKKSEQVLNLNSHQQQQSSNNTDPSSRQEAWNAISPPDVAASSEDDDVVAIDINVRSTEQKPRSHGLDASPLPSGSAHVGSINRLNSSKGGLTPLGLAASKPTLAPGVRSKIHLDWEADRASSKSVGVDNGTMKGQKSAATILLEEARTLSNTTDHSTTRSSTGNSFYSSPAGSSGYGSYTQPTPYNTSSLTKPTSTVIRPPASSTTNAKTVPAQNFRSGVANITSTHSNTKTGSTSSQSSLPYYSSAIRTNTSVPRPPSTPADNSGFQNFGNTCYMNAILQALMSLKPFVSDLSAPDLMKLTAEIDLRSFYRAFLAIADQTLEAGRKTALDPSRVKMAIARNSIRFRNNLQQDAHEFLGSCLSQLEQDLRPFLNAARKNQQLKVLTAKKSTRSSKRTATKRAPATSRRRKIIEDSSDTETAPTNDTSTTLNESTSMNGTLSMNDEKSSTMNETGSTRNEEEEESALGPYFEDGISFEDRPTMLCPSKRNFSGVISCILKCCQCQNESKSVETLRYLSLDVFETKLEMMKSVLARSHPHDEASEDLMDIAGILPEEDEMMSKANEKEKKLFETFTEPPTIEQLLSVYFWPELLERRCEECQHNTALLSRTLIQLPRVLVVHLKRFRVKYDKETANLAYEKVSWPVGISPTLSISPWVDKTSPKASRAPIPFVNDPDGFEKRAKERRKALAKEEEIFLKLVKDEKDEKNAKRAEKLRLRKEQQKINNPAPTRSIQPNNHNNSSTNNKSTSYNNSCPTRSLVSSDYGKVDSKYQDPIYDDVFNDDTFTVKAVSTLADMPEEEFDTPLVKKPKTNESFEENQLFDPLLQPLDDDDDFILSTPRVTIASNGDKMDEDETNSLTVIDSLPTEFEEFGESFNDTYGSSNGTRHLDGVERSFEPPAARNRTVLGKPGLKGGAPVTPPPVSIDVDDPVPNEFDFPDYDDTVSTLYRTYGASGDASKSSSSSSSSKPSWPENSKSKTGSSSKPTIPSIKMKSSGMADLDDEDDDAKTEAPDFDAMAEAEMIMWSLVVYGTDHPDTQGGLDVIDQIPIPQLNNRSSSTKTVSKTAALKNSVPTSKISSVTSNNVNKTLTGNNSSVNKTSTTSKTSSIIDIPEDTEEETLKRVLEESKREATFSRASSLIDATEWDDDEEDENLYEQFIKDIYDGDEVAPLDKKDPCRPVKNFKYHLQAIVHHLGRTAATGHYIADVCQDLKVSSTSKKDKENTASETTTSKKWKSYDDLNVTPKTEDDILNSPMKRTTAYILFYIYEPTISALKD